MEKNRRMTRQKKIILELLRSTNTHPTAEWIYEKARERIPEISLGTVYRNLNLLKELGEIMELSFGGAYKCYDGIPVNHYHYRCRICHRVYDVDMPLVDQLSKLTETGDGHRIETHRLEFSGVCSACLAAGALDREDAG
ncbi:MAG: transcriptional repressor [Peptococcaceae bacterium]|jgi:Fur family ferric uptake transcriptional regulator/Fur family peroxide stress response transcriptional regulator|nr:transcriptional repressor [Peptococcaceae bacterium]